MSYQSCWKRIWWESTVYWKTQSIHSRFLSQTPGAPFQLAVHKFVSYNWHWQHQSLFNNRMYYNCHCATDTTDVQLLRATSTKRMSGFLVQCNFIPGSDAQGCMVVIEGKFENISVRLEREGTCSVGVISTTYPLPSYHRVFGFDIEMDGSVGTLAVPGELRMNISAEVSCTPTPSTTAASSSQCTYITYAWYCCLLRLLIFIIGSGISDWVIGAISAAVAGALIVVAVLLIVPCVSLYKIKRWVFRNTSS